MSRRRPLTVLASLALATPLLLLAPPASAAVPAKPYDFNGDGYPELAVGVPSLGVSRQQGAGVVTVEAGGVVVLPSSAKGLSLDEQVITRDTPGVPGDPAENSLGYTPVSADFDRDGYADLAVGGDGTTILFGSARGLTGARSYRFDESGELLAADFDGDGWVDLAAGQPSADYPTGDYAGALGAVRVYRGGAQGFAAARSAEVRGDRDEPDADRRFGSALGAGDLNGDGVADLVVGAEGPEGFDDDDEGFRHPGSVSVCYGGSGGLTGCTRLVRGLRYAGSSSIAVGNVSGSARNEIVFAVPHPELITDDSGVYEETRVGGAVEILSLSGDRGATTAKAVELTQDSRGVPGSDENFDGFGDAIALGDLDRDGFADLVIGASGEDIGKKKGAGRVTVVYGGAKGYRTSGGKIYDQGTKSVPGKPEKGDAFGYDLALVDHDADGRLDLDVGAPYEDGVQDYPEQHYPGAVSTLPGSGTSFTGKGSRTFTLESLGYAQAAGSEFFGSNLGR